MGREKPLRKVAKGYMPELYFPYDGRPLLLKMLPALEKQGPGLPGLEETEVSPLRKQENDFEEHI